MLTEIVATVYQCNLSGQVV